ncbi:neck protein [Vibrio phage VP-1]|uniref:Neck protein n=1 Tax=Vibrio phage VP-1 TaxID=2234088 RepID=A0A4V0NRU9_9CAUD|nr:neck protein [Vibrio phage VP-1]
MAKIDSKDKMIEYAKRKLGEPVIQVNLDKTQMEDAVDDAIQQFCEWHRDGSESIYFVHKVTAEDVANGYVNLPTDRQIDDVVELLPGDQSLMTSWTTPTGQSLLQMFSVNNTSSCMLSASSFVMMKQRMTTLDKAIGARYPFRFMKYRRRIYCDFKLKADQFLVFSCFENIDPRIDANKEAWEDQWLKRYCTALIKERWGNVLIIANGIKLPGGIELDGNKILDDAKAEIAELETELKDEHQEPAMFFVG